MQLMVIFGPIQRLIRGIEATYMNRGRLTRRGFTLTEAMIAMVILSFATAAVILPFATGATMNAEGAKRTIAAKLAADKLEEITYSSIEACSGNFPPEMAGFFNDDNYNLILTDGAYSRFRRLVECTEEIRLETMWYVTVIVYYDEEEVLKMSRLFGP